jgi:hypothetical protein
VRRRLGLRTCHHPFFLSGLTIFGLLLSTGCGGKPIDTGSIDPRGYRLPLTVELRLDRTVTEAEISYRDACRQPRAIAIGKELRDRLHHEMGRVFERVNLAPAQTKVDGAIEIALGLNELALHVFTQRERAYPATVTLGASLAYVNAAGEVLYTKNLRTDTPGEAGTEAGTCEVSGLQQLAREAIGRLGEGLKTHLATSTRLRAAAEANVSRPTVR